MSSGYMPKRKKLASSTRKDKGEPKAGEEGSGKFGSRKAKRGDFEYLEA